MSSGDIRPVTHLIFDIDGLLLDSESVWTRIMEVLLEPYGAQFNWDIKLKMMGKKENEAGKMLIDMLKLPLTVEEYMQKVQQLQAEMMPDAEVMPGIERLINHLVKHKVPIAVATGNSEYEFSLKEKGHSEFFKKFHHKVKLGKREFEVDEPINTFKGPASDVLSGSDPEVIHGKPAPDCFLVCAKRFPHNPDPSKVLVFEDAPNGVEGAVNAGMQVVWIPDPKVDKALCQDNATLTLNSATEFKPELFGLPPYGS